VLLSFLVNRPANEPGFRLDRLESKGRNMHYATRAYAAERPEGERYR
jgi:ribulose-bisphosphate carboxylase small chain